MSATVDVGLADVTAARDRIAPYVVRTPTVEQPRLSELLGRRVVTKLELFQHSGSFKARGAFHRMLLLDDAERAAGVVAVSGGNHGLAVAYAANRLRIDAKVIMPSTTPAGSIAGARGEGADVVLTDSIADAFAAAHAEAAAGRTLVHPFDDPAVIAAQGTLALELVDDVPDLTDVVVSIGGGGLIAGVASVVRAHREQARVWGVETEGADAMTLALEAGHPVPRVITSIAKTLGAPEVADRTLAAVRAQVEEVLVVPDADAVRGIETFAAHCKVLAEPAAGCTWPAALRLRDRLPDDAVVALVVCGGNVSLDDVATWRRDLL